jgi:DNA (cytosine-5)-methyltransferase 1
MNNAGMTDKGPDRQRSPRAFNTVGLFAGIGGFELGFARAGHNPLLLCEIDPAACEVLAQRFPGTPIHNDIRTLQALPEGADVLLAGFPCQDLSQAGRAAGIFGTSSGLVSQVFSLLKSHRVPWVLLENVPFMLQLSRGRGLDYIAGELESLGYQWAYRVVDTRAFGIPQRRARVFLLAGLHDDPRDVLYADDHPRDVLHTDDLEAYSEPHGWRKVACGFYWTEGTRGLGWAFNSIPTLKGGSRLGIPSPPAVIMPGGTVIKPDIRDAERLQGFPSNWTRRAEAVAKKGHRWTLVGNAISVPVSTWLAHRLATPKRYKPRTDTPLVTGRWPRAAYNVGSGRFKADVSAWPARRTMRPLATFLRYSRVRLSHKAAQGFYSRARASSLTFPPGFLQLIKAHIAAARDR